MGPKSRRHQRSARPVDVISIEQIRLNERSGGQQARENHDARGGFILRVRHGAVCHFANGPAAYTILPPTTVSRDSSPPIWSTRIVM